jgi:hypothetical protein
VIGPTWIEEAGTQSRHRLYEHDDLLRAEIEAALSSSCVVIPVCVGGARPPEAAVLPSSIRALAGLQVMHVRRGADFHPDMDRLIAMVSSLPPAQANSVWGNNPNATSNQRFDHCSFCQGTGKRNCPQCHGSARKACTRCGGSGQRFVGASKANPSGLGRCSSCSGGRMTCACGSGKVNCGDCDGTGKIRR